jgi:predicted PP-loop superfamily ATPase
MGKIFADLSDHFGESVELDSESEKMILTYLKANAANYSSGKLSAKIMRSLDNKTPLRITEVPYIQREHHEIQQTVLDRESIGSLSNCAACHTSAEEGIYDDDNVTIPR